MQKVDVYRRIKAALERLLKEDAFLLVVDANERSISHKLAVYLEYEFDEWDVDCEYNRIGEDHVKKVLEFEEVEKCYNTRKVDSSEVAVFPDIIIHERGKPSNLVVIEVKKSWSPSGKECDILKLQKYKQQLGYAFPFFIVVGIQQDGPFYRVFDEREQEIRLDT